MVPPSVFCVVTYYFVYPSTPIPYSINRNGIVSVVRVGSGVLNTVRGAIGIPDSRGKIYVL